MKIFVLCFMLLAVCFFGYGASNAERGVKSSQGKGKLRETIANETLQGYVKKVIFKSDSAADPSCARRSFTKPEIVQAPKAGLWTERWTINRCGKKIPYLVRFIEGQNGDTSSAFILQILSKGVPAI